MDKHEFYKKIDNLASEWYIDTVEPVSSRVRKKDGTMVTGTRQPERGKEWTGPNWTGWAQVISWQPNKSQCQFCQQTVDDAYQTINLRTGHYSCDRCGIKKGNFRPTDSQDNK